LTQHDRMPLKRCPDGLTVLTGGARSGKSDLAERLAAASTASVTFIATATAGDADMAARIARHQTSRSDQWRTIEEPLDLVGALTDAGDIGPVIVDCLTLWTSNHLFGGVTGAGGSLIEVADAVAALAVSRLWPTIVVTNEVGFGIHPDTELVRSYRDLLGLVNRSFTSVAARTWLVVAGRVVPLGEPGDLL
jgi:adenosylcobinamide kinase/adenosylcobinamide-phosphate guanylyltransferase